MIHHSCLLNWALQINVNRVFNRLTELIMTSMILFGETWYNGEIRIYLYGMPFTTTNQSCMDTLSHHFLGWQDVTGEYIKTTNKMFILNKLQKAKTKDKGFRVRGIRERESMCVCLCTNEPTPGLIESSKESVLSSWRVDYSNKFAKILIIIHSAVTTAQGCQFGTSFP